MIRKLSTRSEASSLKLAHVLGPLTSHPTPGQHPAQHHLGQHPGHLGDRMLKSSPPRAQPMRSENLYLGNRLAQMPVLSQKKALGTTHCTLPWTAPCTACQNPPQHPAQRLATAPALHPAQHPASPLPTFATAPWTRHHLGQHPAHHS